MPTSYKGLTIPSPPDLADGPTDFTAYTDSLPNQIFATTAARDAWASPPNGATCTVVADYSRWLRRGGVWSDLTNRHTSRALAAVGVGTAVVGLGSIPFAAVPYPRTFLISAMTFITNSADSIFQFYVTCGANGATSFYVRGLGDGTSLAIPAFTVDVPANTVGDVFTFAQKIGTTANGNTSGDGRYAHLDISYRGV